MFIITSLIYPFICAPMALWPSRLGYSASLPRVEFLLLLVHLLMLVLLQLLALLQLQLLVQLLLQLLLLEQLLLLLLELQLLVDAASLQTRRL